jgi:hypothetical protein
MNQSLSASRDFVVVMLHTTMKFLGRRPKQAGSLVLDPFGSIDRAMIRATRATGANSDVNDCEDL